MSKLATVQALSDSAPPPERLRATMELQRLQRQLGVLTQQVQDLGQTLTRWAQASAELSTAQRREVLDLAVLIEPIPERLAAIEHLQRAQDERLTKIEAALEQVTAALPQVKGEDGRLRRPRLASRDDLAAVPAKVWESKPSLFGKS